MIPRNWCWTTLNDCAECLDNLRVPVNAKERSKRIGNIPYYGATGQTGWIDNYLTNEQLVLLGEDGAPFLDIFKDKAYIIDGKAWINNHVHILKSYFGDIGNRYLKYYLNNFDFKDYVSGTTRLKLTQSKMKSIPIPLPPLYEQQRIVDIIENLFSKLDRAKALAQNVVDNYELRRSAILHKAFTGQLTNPDLNDWKIFSWESCIKKMQNGISKRNGDTGDEIIVLRLYDIKNNEINLSNARTISLNDKEQENYLLKINNLLMIRVNGSKDNVGKQLLIKSSDKLAFCDHLIRIQYIDEIFPKYMLYFSQCKDYKDYVLANIVSSAGQNTISRKGMTNLNIPIPNIDEQKEIVRILDSLLAKEQRTKELAEQILQKIDLMKKSILARAFRGALMTNTSNL